MFRRPVDDCIRIIWKASKRRLSMPGRIKAKYRKGSNGKKILQTYEGQWYDRHRVPSLKRISFDTRDYTAAQLIFGDRERERVAGLWDPWNDPLKREGMLVSEAEAAFLVSRAGNRQATKDNYEGFIRRFRESLPVGMLIQSVETRHILAFLDSRQKKVGDKLIPLSPTSRRTYLRHLGVFFRWCKSQGFIDYNPVPKPDRVPKRKKKELREFLREEEAASLVRAIEAEAILKSSVIRDGNAWIIYPIRFVLGTGLRRGEICNLRWSAIDMKTGFVFVKNIRDEEDASDFETKSGEERAIPLVGDALLVIRELHERRTTEADDYVFTGAKGGQLNARQLTRRFAYYRDQAKLPKSIHFHSLRHTFASWWVLRGGDLFRLKEVLGHSDIRETMIYAHLRPDALKEEMIRCFGQNRDKKITNRRKRSRILRNRAVRRMAN